MFNITDLYHKMVNNPDLSGHFGLLTHWHPDDEEYTKKILISQSRAEADAWLAKQQ